MPVVGSVSRVTVTPPILIVAEAFTVKLPTLELLMVSVHVAVFPENATDAPHVVLCELGAGLTLGVIFALVAAVAPSGACVTVIVKMCDAPTWFTAVPGVRLIDAST